MQRRQLELEEVVQKLLVEQGPASLTMEKIALEAGCSRPTVYEHFCSTMEAIAVVVRQAISITRAHYESAIKAQGSPREKALAHLIAYEVQARFHPQVAQLMEVVSFPWVQKDLPEEAVSGYTSLITDHIRMLCQYLAQSEKEGTLTLPKDAHLDQLAFHSINLAYGIYSAIIKQRLSYRIVTAQHDPWLSARQALNFLWDGYGWGPTSAEHDYEKSYDRILKTVFPNYWIRVRTEALEKELVEIRNE